MSVVSVMTHPDRQEWLNLTSELTSYLLDLGNSVRMIPVEAEAIGKSERTCAQALFKTTGLLIGNTGQYWVRL